MGYVRCLQHELGSPAKTCVGTLVYMAPEIIMGGKHYDAKVLRPVASVAITCLCLLFHPCHRTLPILCSSGPYTEIQCCVMQKADLWSCGVILYTMLYGRHPFDASMKQYARKVVSGDYTIPVKENVSAECVALVRQLLNPCPDQRISLSHILQQPWFKTALPSGALAMNDFYCNFSIPLDQVGHVPGCKATKVLQSASRKSICSCPNCQSQNSIGVSSLLRACLPTALNATYAAPASSERFSAFAVHGKGGEDHCQSQCSSFSRRRLQRHVCCGAQ